MLQCYLQASLPFGRHPYCSMWWRRNLYSDQREGPSLTWGPRWDQQTRRAAPARLHTNPLGFFQQTPDEEQRNSRAWEFIKHKYTAWYIGSFNDTAAPTWLSIKENKDTLIYLCSNPWLCSFEHILRRGTSIFSLPCGDIQGVSCPLQ